MCVTTEAELLKNLNGYLTAAGNDEKVYVTSATGNVVIVSEEYLRSLEETIYLQSISGMSEKIVEGINTPPEECEEIDWRKELK